MLELRILTGLHRGAALPLDGDAIRIGSAAENDVVLLDPGMPALACAIYRSEVSGWRYRAVGPVQSADEAFDAAPGSDGAALTAGARWFAGPVLIGCDEESSPWPSGQPQPDVPRPGQCNARPRSLKTKLYVALAALVGLASLGAVLALRTPPQGITPSRPATATTSTLYTASAMSATSATTSAMSTTAVTKPNVAVANTPVRVVSGIVYPSHTQQRPPFAISRASTGPYGFLVTNDGQVLMPGSRRGAFTLVRIEPGRAVFSGPHAAELTW